MDRLKFSSKIEDFRSELAEVIKRAKSEGPSQQEAIEQAYENLLTALEELNIAEEELLQQNDELLAAHLNLEAERLRYQELFDFAPDGYLETDSKGIIRETNRAATALLHMQQENLHSKPFAAFLSKKDQHTFYSLLNQLGRIAIRPGQVDLIRGWEARLKPYRHPAFDAAITVSVVLGREARADQTPTLRWLVRDITLRKQAEAALQQKTAQVQLLQRVASAANEASRPEEAFQIAVDEICGYTGWEVGHVYLLAPGPDLEMISAGIWHIAQPRKLKAFRQASDRSRFRPGEGLLGQVFKTGKPLWIPNITQELSFTRAEELSELPGCSGLYFPIRIGKSVAGILEFFTTHLEEPDPTLLEVFSQVGTQLGRVIERQQAEEAIRNEKEFREDVINSIYNGLLAFDRSYCLTIWNPRLEEITGLSSSQVLGRHVFDALPFLKEIGGEPFFAQALRGESAVSRDRPYKIPETGRGGFFEGHYSPLRNPTGEVIGGLCIFRDITAQKELETELAELRRRMIEGNETERLHLAQELHDGPLQDLHGVTYMLDLLNDHISKPHGGSQLEEIRKSLLKVTAEVREICGELRPPTLAPFGLEKAIRSHAGHLQELNPELNFGLDLVNDRQILPENLRLALFRIYQSIITNVLRHAQAKNILIHFGIEENQILLAVQDDGQGFSVPKRWIDLVRRGHFGLVGAAERAQALGGQLQIESNPGEGTQIRVSVPIEPEATIGRPGQPLNLISTIQ